MKNVNRKINTLRGWQKQLEADKSRTRKYKTKK